MVQGVPARPESYLSARAPDTKQTRRIRPTGPGHLPPRKPQPPTSVPWLGLGFKKGQCSPYSITERRVPELIPVLGSQPAGDVSHKPGGMLPLLSARPAVTPATL